MKHTVLSPRRQAVLRQSIDRIAQPMDVSNQKSAENELKSDSQLKNVLFKNQNCLKTAKIVPIPKNYMHMSYKEWSLEQVVVNFYFLAFLKIFYRFLIVSIALQKIQNLPFNF